MRVMRVLTRPNLGGPTRQALALHAAGTGLGLRTLLVVGRCEAGEAALDLRAASVPLLPFTAALQRGPEAEGIVQLDDLRAGIAPWRDRRAGRALRQLLHAFLPDVVHTHTSKAGWLGRAAAAAAGVPVVAHTFHGHVLRDYAPAVRGLLLRWLERRSAARTDLLFAVSASCADELAALGVADRSRIAVLPPAVATAPPPAGARHRARAMLGIGDGDFAAVCAGRLVPIKRTAHFLQAVAAAGVRGDVFGDGPLLAGLRAAAGPAITFRGADPAFPSLLAAYDALLLPSRREGYPLVAVEAFAAGVPLVGYAVPGVRDALGDGRGLLVPELEGPAGLARALATLRSEPALARQLAATAAAALPQFAPADVARRLVAAYHSAANGRLCYPGPAVG